MNDEKRAASTTTDGQPADPGLEEAGAPKPIDPSTGMHGAYWVLSAEERAKGFVRPVRISYKHVGIMGPKYPLRDLTPEEERQYEAVKYGYVKFEEYPPELRQGCVTGTLWTQKRLDSVGKGCQTVTTMSRVIAETYARDPSYYGSTFCVQCRSHIPVGVAGEFVWDGTTDRVGT